MQYPIKHTNLGNMSNSTEYIKNNVICSTLFVYINKHIKHIICHTSGVKSWKVLRHVLIVSGIGRLGLTS